MLKSAATLEDGGKLGIAVETERMKPGNGIMRFAYATGSRPLDGYTIKRGVGAGGFGEVYFAVSDAGKEVALKRIQRNLDVEIRGVSQCLNLKHPNLVAIFDIRYDDEGQAWVVMEYVRGESLKDVIERNPNGVPDPEAMHWFRGIAEGVSYLHDHGIIHRDLKPGNVFLDESLVKIGDYGLSKYISCSRRSGQTESVGTFHYMAPEIGRGVYGKEIDIYALGIILYEMQTGRVPFEGESSQEIIMKHLTATPDLAPLPAGLRPVVQQALFKDPEKRYRNVDDLLAAVELALGTAPARTRFVAHAATSSSAAGRTERETFFIGAAPEVDGMYFGPVTQVADAEPLSPIPIAASAACCEEPIARAVRDSWANVTAWWKGPQLNRAGRIILGVAFVILFVMNVGWIMPVAAILGTSYLVYLGVRAIVVSPRSRPAVPTATSPFPRSTPASPNVPDRFAMVSTPAAPVAVPGRTKSTAAKRRRWHQVAREQLRVKSPGERLTELTGSMLMSSIVVGVASLLMLVMAGYPMDGSVSTWTRFAWLGLTSLAGTWSILIPAKLWEGVEGDAVRRRFLQVILGLVVGAAAFELDQYLGPTLANAPVIDMPRVWNAPATMLGHDGSPKLPAYLTYFAGLFALLRWWQQADPLRTGRYSLWSTVVSLGVALLWQLFWPFPQPWGFMVPVAMSVAVQLSAPWISTNQRNDLRKLAEVA